MCGARRSLRYVRRDGCSAATVQERGIGIDVGDSENMFWMAKRGYIVI